MTRLSAMCRNWVGGYFSVSIDRGKQTGQNGRETFNVINSNSIYAQSLLLFTVYQNLIFYKFYITHSLSQ